MKYLFALLLAITLAAPASATIRRNVQVQKIVTVQPRVQRVVVQQQLVAPHVQQFVVPQQFYAPQQFVAPQQFQACPQQLNGGCQQLFR